MKTISHVDDKGRPTMVDISEKSVTERTAVARSIVSLPPQMMADISSGELHTAKGPVVQTAILAGIMAAKKTGELIPLCHPLGLDNCQVSVTVENNDFIVECRVSTSAKTGVEMEALVGASIASLTIYDMCKALSHDIIIRDTRLMLKTGGKNDFERK